MRNILLLSAFLLCALYAVAQSSSSQSPASQNSAATTGQTSGSEHHQSKVRGCLSGSGNEFTLTDKSGTSYHLTGDTSKLTEHVGHTVEVTGTKSSLSTGHRAATSPAAGSATQESLDVSSVKHISPTCTSGGASH